MATHSSILAGVAKESDMPERLNTANNKATLRIFVLPAFYSLGVSFSDSLSPASSYHSDLSLDTTTSEKSSLIGYPVFLHHVVIFYEADFSW